MEGREPWTEELRPQSFSEMIGNHGAVRQVVEMLRSGCYLNLLFSGPCGCGKTSLAQCIITHYIRKFGNGCVLELNASDARTAGIIYSRIRPFERSLRFEHRLIFLDEVDGMTNSAQRALAALMDDQSNTTQFIMACNEPQRVLTVLQSHVLSVFFSSIPKLDIQKALQQISCKKKLWNITTSALEAIAEDCGGDMRRAIGLIECLAVSKTKLISKNEVAECNNMEIGSKTTSLPSVSLLSSLNILTPTTDEIQCKLFCSLSRVKQQKQWQDTIRLCIDINVNARKKDNLKVAFELIDEIWENGRGWNDLVEMVAAVLSAEINDIFYLKMQNLIKYVAREGATKSRMQGYALLADLMQIK